MATKPRGRPESRSAPTTPIKPSGATLSARTRRRKLFSWNIKTVIMMRSISGTTAITEACDFLLSSTVPPTAIA